MTSRRQEHGFLFEQMVKEHISAKESEDIRFDLVHEDTPMQLKTTVDKTLRMGRYKTGLEISQDFYLVYAIHDKKEIKEVKSYLIDGLSYNRQFSFMIQHYFDEHIKPLPDRSGHYKEYFADIKYMTGDKLISPAVKKGGGGNNRLQAYLHTKDIPKLGTEVDLGLSFLLKKQLENA